MKIIFYISILFTLSSQIIGQTFKQYNQTQFYFNSATKKLKGGTTENAYIKKGDTILILSKVDINKFLYLFEITPSSFDSLIKKLPWIGYKHSDTDKFDKVLRKTKYKVHAEIGIVNVIEKENQLIWEIENSNYATASNSCYSSIIFKIKNKAALDKTKIENLEYVKVVGRHCDI